MSTKLHDQVRETMRKAEDRAKSRRRDYTRATIEHDGREADLDSPEAESVVEEFVAEWIDPNQGNRMPSGQAIIPGMERELLHRDSLVKAKVEELLRELDVEGAEVAVSVKIPTQTRIDYVLMDVETKISVKMKPAAEPK